MTRTAQISDCGQYRYRLTRQWEEGTSLCFVMLNPSIADADIDDPTIRRCIGFAKREGFGGIIVVNMFAFRATSPKDLPADHATATGGQTNDRAILDACAEAKLVVCAWGVNATPDGIQQTTGLIRSIDRTPLCLGATKAGHPRHPLYLKNDAPLIVWKQAVTP